MKWSYVSWDWGKGNFTGTEHPIFDCKKPWFPVDFPLFEPIQ